MKPHPVLYDEPRDDGADDARDGADGVGDAHQDGGVLRGDVQVVDGEASPVVDSFVKFGGFGIRFETDLDKFVKNSVADSVKFDEICAKSNFKPDKLD